MNTLNLLNPFQDDPTHLDEYVHRDDGMFSWYLHDVIYYNNVRVLLVNMTSQQWLDGMCELKFNDQSMIHVTEKLLNESPAQIKWSCSVIFNVIEHYCMKYHN